jgi:hypothetical protein
MTYNTFTARNRLVERGFSVDEAEAVLEAIEEHDEAAGAGLATKADLADVRGDFRALRMEIRFWIAGAVVVILGAIKWAH